MLDVSPAKPERSKVLLPFLFFSGVSFFYLRHKNTIYPQFLSVSLISSHNVSNSVGFLCVFLQGKENGGCEGKTRKETGF